MLDQKIDVITALEANRKAPVENMTACTTCWWKKRMWYTQIEENVNQFKLSGIDVDNQTVADFMTRIEKSGNFENVRLASIKQFKNQGNDLKLKQLI